MDARDFLLGTWAALILVALSCPFNAFLRSLVMHGKQRANVDVAKLPLQFLVRAEIMKSRWTWFYAIGAMLNGYLTCLVLIYPASKQTQSLLHVLQNVKVSSGQEMMNQMAHPGTVLFMCCFTVQLIRRLLESCFITQFGKSQMHVSVLVLGFVHYLLIGFSALADVDAVAEYEWTTGRSVITVVGVCLFVYASYHQFVCNRLLAHQKLQNKMKHVIPRGDWFEHARAPLFTTEILIYFSFALVCGGRNMMVNVIFFWVLCNQSVCANNSFEWYETKFRDQCHQLPRWRLVPYIW